MPEESQPPSKLKNNLYKLSILSFIVVVIWIGFEIYFSYNQQPQDIQVTRQLQPISSNLHLDLADSLSQRLSISAEELEAFKTTAINEARRIQALSKEEEQSIFSPPAPPASQSASIDLSPETASASSSPDNM